MSAETRDWRSFWSSVPTAASSSPEDALRQVGKTLLGQPVGDDQIVAMVRSILGALDLSPGDHVIDLGCGNGILTEQVARHVDAVCAVDLSPSLIADAQRHRGGDTVRYRMADLALGVDTGVCPHRPTAAYAYEVLQHLTPDETGGLLRSLRSHYGADLRVFIASIPDFARIRAFYDTPERWAHFERQSAAGTEQIGTWWERDLLRGIAEKSGFHCTVREQPAVLYTAHYRFDAVLRAAGDVDD